MIRFKNKNLDKKKKNALAQVHHGEIRHSFYAPEFLEYQRGPIWYLVAGFIGLTIIALGILTDAFTLTLAFLIFIGVYWLLHNKEPKILEVAITQHGIKIEGDDFIPFGEISEFWMIYSPPFVADLKLKVNRKWNSVRTIHIFGQEPEELRQLLAPHITEVFHEEELSDLIVRALRL